MRPRTIVLGLAAIVIVAMVVLTLVDHLLVDYLWYGRLGYGGVFNTTVAAEIGIFGMVWLVAFAAIFARGALDFKETPPRVTLGAAAQLSVLLGLFFVQRAMSYWLGRFDLLLHSNGVVFGLRYVDRILWQPGLWLLVALSLGAAVMCIL